VKILYIIHYTMITLCMLLCSACVGTIDISCIMG